MNIQILPGKKEVSLKIKGLAVVIDVLRAFSTACYIASNGAEKIIPVASIKEAYLLKNNNSKYLLIGEQNGIVPTGFDYGNSPTEVKDISFLGKTVILVTTLGTKAIHLSSESEDLITGSFVNARAIENYIKRGKYEDVCLVYSDYSDADNEDILLAEYLRNRLKRKPVKYQQIIKQLETEKHSAGFLINPMSPTSAEDFRRCLELDKFNFILKLKKDEKEQLYLSKIDVKTE